jgi:multidrug resistance efflux pump
MTAQEKLIQQLDELNESGKQLTAEIEQATAELTKARIDWEMRLRFRQGQDCGFGSRYDS